MLQNVTVSGVLVSFLTKASILVEKSSYFCTVHSAYEIITSTFIRQVLCES